MTEVTLTRLIDDTNEYFSGKKQTAGTFIEILHRYHEWRYGRIEELEKEVTELRKQLQE